MADFRNALYEEYVSRFKIVNAPTDKAFQQALDAEIESRYLPFISGLDRECAILEVGCGPGDILEFLRKHGFLNTRGIDISEEQVQLATEKGLDVTKTDVFDFLKDRREEFAAILAIDFVEHFTKEELLQLFPRMYDSLNKSGVLIVKTPNGQGLFPNQVVYGDLTHLTIFTPSSLSQLLQVFGFKNISLYETDPVPNNLNGKMRAILWRMIKIFANAIRRIETGKTQQVWTESFICQCQKE